jgi:hypothetical protein
MLLLTMPVVWIYASTQGEVSLVVLAAIALAATGVDWGLRWLLSPALVHALGTGIGPGRYRLWSGTSLQLWAIDVMLSLAAAGAERLPADEPFPAAARGHDRSRRAHRPPSLLWMTNRSRWYRALLLSVVVSRSGLPGPRGTGVWRRSGRHGAASMPRRSCPVDRNCW